MAIVIIILSLPADVLAFVGAFIISLRAPRRINGALWFRPRFRIPAAGVTLGPHVVLHRDPPTDYLIRHESHHCLQARTVAVSSLIVAYWAPWFPPVAWFAFVGISYGLATLLGKNPYYAACIEKGAYAVSDSVVDSGGNV